MDGVILFFFGVFKASVPILLLFGGLFLLCRMRFVFFLHPIRCFSKMKGEAGDREAAPLRAVTLALAGTLGVGNISGVGLAILTAGAGSIFWMWVSALFAMALKYAEVLLALRYRPRSRADAVGACRGGAMYYMKAGIGGRLGRRMAGLFALLCLVASFTLGSMIQANAVGECAESGFGLSALVAGLFLFVFAGITLAGGRRRIEKMTEKLVPLATLLYIGMTGIMIWQNRSMLPNAVWLIFENAFRPESAAVGGILGIFVSKQAVTGCARGLLSNEAGAGTAPMAHVGSETGYPARQGLFGILEVFVDTLLLCSLTAFAVLTVCPTLPEGVAGGTALCLYAAEKVFGSVGKLLLSSAILIFALATILCWAYYGENCLLWFTNRAKMKKAYRVLYCLLLPVGAVFSVRLAFAVTDAVLVLLTILNTLTVLYLSGEVVRESRRYGLLSPRGRRKKPSPKDEGKP